MGIKINNNFELLDEQDDGFIVDDVLVRGGHSVVTNTTERDRIPLSARKVGMTVHVSSHQKDYQLVGGITNSSWKEKTLGDVDLPAYAKLAGATFTGLISNMLDDVQLQYPIREIIQSFNKNTEFDLISIQLSADDLRFVGEYSIVFGKNSGATAVVIRAVAEGLIIPSKLVSLDDPSFRAGEFIQGEQLIIKSGPALARRPQDVMTRKAVEALAITRYGGNCYGYISNWPHTEYTLSATVASMVDYNSLSVVELKMNFTDVDRPYLNDGMTLQGPRGDKFTILRLNRKHDGFIIKNTDKSKVRIGDEFKIINTVMVPLKPEHLASRQYVDDQTSRTEIVLNPKDFANIGTVSDPISGKSRTLYTFTIPSTLHSNGWPVVTIYKVVVADSYTDYMQIPSDMYRHVIRTNEAGSDIIIQAWDVVPTQIKVVIH